MKTRPAPSAAVSAYEPDDEGRASFRHNFWETARKNPGIRIVIYFSVPPPPPPPPYATLTAERAARAALTYVNAPPASRSANVGGCGRRYGFAATSFLPLPI